MPGSVQEAVDLCESGGVAATTKITVATGGGRQWPEIVAAEVGDKPLWLEESADITSETYADAPF